VLPVLRLHVLIIAAAPLLACARHEARDAGATPCALPSTDTITADLELVPHCTARVDKHYVVGPGGRLVLREGVRLAFQKGASLRVDGGVLVAKGTARGPVVFTSAEPSPAPGDWGGIVLSRGSHISALEYAVVEYAGGEAPDASAALTVLAEAPGFTMDTSIVRRNKRAGMRVVEARSRLHFERNTFESNDGTSLRLPADLMGSLDASRYGDPVRIRGDITRSQTWPQLDVPVVAMGDLSIASTAKNAPAVVIIAPRTVVKFAPGTCVHVGSAGEGAIVARRVHFTSASDSPAPGDWCGIVFHAPSTETDIDHCTFEYTGHGRVPFGSVLVEQDTRAKITNTTFRAITGPAIGMSGPCGDWNSVTKGNTAAGGPLCENTMWSAGFDFMGSAAVQGVLNGTDVPPDFTNAAGARKR